MALESETAPAKRDGLQKAVRSLPAYGTIGLALVAASWMTSWSHWRPWSEWTFAPLWFGYILVVNALVYRRKGQSLLHSRGHRILRLLLVSAVVWWVFEAFNLRTQNWIYIQPTPVGPIRFVLEASLDFSTVLPAIFETAALLRCMSPTGMTSFLQRRSDAGIRLSPATGFAWMGLGIVSLFLALWNPSLFFPGVWLCLLLLVDPINALLGQPSLLVAVRNGQWRDPAILGLAGLVCGFFWEMWNSLAMPKWTYHVPVVPQQRLFEMPYLGYLGYIPFAMECYAVYNLAQYLWGSRVDVLSGSV